MKKFIIFLGALLITCQAYAAALPAHIAALRIDKKAQNGFLDVQGVHGVDPQWGAFELIPAVRNIIERRNHSRDYYKEQLGLAFERYKIHEALRGVLL